MIGPQPKCHARSPNHDKLIAGTQLSPKSCSAEEPLRHALELVQGLRFTTAVKARNSTGQGTADA
jgi:hypothetical protein